MYFEKQGFDFFKVSGHWTSTFAADLSDNHFTFSTIYNRPLVPLL